MAIDLATVAEWEGAAELLVSLGVKSFHVIRAAMENAGEDDATIQALGPKWQALTDDIARAASNNGEGNNSG